MDDYMVHFDFKLTPSDAENFAHLFSKDICNLREDIMHEMVNR